MTEHFRPELFDDSDAFQTIKGMVWNEPNTGYVQLFPQTLDMLNLNFLN
jgi:hypothetical protein